MLDSFSKASSTPPPLKKKKKNIHTHPSSCKQNTTIAQETTDHGPPSFGRFGVRSRCDAGRFEQTGSRLLRTGDPDASSLSASRGWMRRSCFSLSFHTTKKAVINYKCKLFCLVKALGRECVWFVLGLLCLCFFFCFVLCLCCHFFVVCILLYRSTEVYFVSWRVWRGRWFLAQAHRKLRLPLSRSHCTSVLHCVLK